MSTAQTSPASAPTPAKRESPFVSLLINVVAPVLLLNHLGKWIPSLNPWAVLGIAMCFPLFGAAENFWRKRKVGLLPALGFVNVLGTGGLAALGVGGIWFAVKEAFFPALIGIFVLRSAFTPKPFIETLLLNESLVHTDRISNALDQRNVRTEFLDHMKRSTLWVSGSFFLSAALNFGLAVYVFVPLAGTLSANERTQALNEQVARMTGLGFAVIALPSALCMGVIFWYLLRDLRRLTGLKEEDIFRG